jgi:two-component system phosphate regulon sensor histidine kinase PhoR
MYTIDLQLLLFLLVVASVLMSVLIVWLDRRLLRRRRANVERGATLAALDDAPFGVLRLTGAGEVEMANPAALRLLGLTAPVGALPEEDWADRLLADVEAGQGRYRLTPLSPDRWLRVWTSASGRLVFLFDATDQQRADEAARRLLNDLGHELRTPLATILTHVEVQALPNLPEVTRSESQRLLKEETLRTVRLVNGMLELSRLEISSELVQRPVDLLALAEAAVQQMTPQAEKRAIVLLLEASTPAPATLGDADQLLRVFLNLLDNAVKYCRSGDKVTVALRCEAAHVHCSVCDTGPGIPAQHLPFVTRPFYRAALPGQDGSGLGLALVEEILRRHGSALQIESRNEGDTGTCMRFQLPALAHEASAKGSRFLAPLPHEEPRP